MGDWTNGLLETRLRCSCLNDELVRRGCLGSFEFSLLSIEAEGEWKPLTGLRERFWIRKGEVGLPGVHPLLDWFRIASFDVSRGEDVGDCDKELRCCCGCCCCGSRCWALPCEVRLLLKGDAIALVYVFNGPPALCYGGSCSRACTAAET